MCKDINRMTNHEISNFGGILGPRPIFFFSPNRKGEVAWWSKEGRGKCPLNYYINEKNRAVWDRGKICQAANKKPQAVRQKRDDNTDSLRYSSTDVFVVVERTQFVDFM